MWDITAGKLGVKQQSSRSFAWTDRGVQPTYELIRQGKMPQSDSLLGRTLNSMAGARARRPPAAAADRRQQAARLRLVRKSLGPSTAAMTSEENGWFIKGVLLTK